MTHSDAIASKKHLRTRNTFFGDILKDAFNPVFQGAIPAEEHNGTDWSTTKPSGDAQKARERRQSKFAFKGEKNPSLPSKLRKIQVYFQSLRNPSLLSKVRNDMKFHFQEEIKQVAEGEAIKVTKIFFTFGG